MCEDFNYLEYEFFFNPLPTHIPIHISNKSSSPVRLGLLVSHLDRNFIYLADKLSRV